MRRDAGYYCKGETEGRAKLTALQKSKENFGHPGAVPNNDNIPASLQTIKSGADIVHPDGPKR